MIERDVLGQVRRELALASERLGGAKQPDLVKVMFMLGNPDHEHLMKIAGGYYGMGGGSEWLYLLAWPSEEVIGRIGALAVHEFHHLVRFANVVWDPVAVTVGEHVVAEGLAEAFVRELLGPEAMGPWSSMVTGPEYERAHELIMADFDLAGMQHTPAYVLGDSATRNFGGEPRGIPDMAGYAVGLNLVEPRPGRHRAERGGGDRAARGRAHAARGRAPVTGQLGETKPDSYAAITAWVRSRAPSLASTLPTCVLTVSGLTTSSAAISGFDRPLVISRSTSPSRPVSRSMPGTRAGEAPWRPARARIAAGNSSDSPVATSRTARTRSSGLARLSRKPLAPARRAS